MSFKKLIFQSILWRGLYFVSVLLLNVFIARYFQASNSGTIYFINNSLALFLLPISMCLESGIGYYTATGEIAIDKLGNLALTWTIAAAAIIAGFLLWFGSRIPFLASDPGYLFIPLYYLCGCMLTNYVIAIMYARKNFTLPNIILIIVNLALVAVLIAEKNNSAEKSIFVRLYFAGFFVQGLLLALILYWKNFSEWRLRLPRKSETSKIIRYSLQALAANVIFFLVYRIDYWFVNWYCSSADLGNYIQVSKLVQIFLIIPTIIASVIFPYIASGRKKESVDQVKSVCHLLLLLFSLVCIVLAVVSNKLFPFLFGQSFDRMYVPFLLIIPGILSLAVLTPLSAYFAGGNKVKVNIISSCIGLVVIIVGDLTWIPSGGIKAAALVSSLGYLACLCFSLYSFIKAEKTSIGSVLLFTKKDFNLLQSLLKKNTNIPESI